MSCYFFSFLATYFLFQKRLTLVFSFVFLLFFFSVRRLSKARMGQSKHRLGLAAANDTCGESSMDFEARFISITTHSYLYWRERFSFSCVFVTNNEITHKPRWIACGCSLCYVNGIEETQADLSKPTAFFVHTYALSIKQLSLF